MNKMVLCVSSLARSFYPPYTLVSFLLYGSLIPRPKFSHTLTAFEKYGLDTFTGKTVKIVQESKLRLYIFMSS